MRWATREECGSAGEVEIEHQVGGPGRTGQPKKKTAGSSEPAFFFGQMRLEFPGIF